MLALKAASEFELGEYKGGIHLKDYLIIYLYFL